MELELRHFKIICAVAEAGSITKAASTLGLAQPALTAQLHRIERALGGPLFERDRKGARPTPLGELVLSRAKLLLPAVSGLREEAARFANNAALPGDTPSRLRLGSATGPVLGGLVHQLNAAYPDLHVTTHVSWSSEELAAMVADGRVDYTLAGVCGDAPPPSQPGLIWRTVATDPVFVLLSTQHPLAGRDAVDLSDLAGVQWGATPGDGCFADCFAAACARAGFTPRTLYETDVVSCIDLVESGDAVVLCQPMFRQMPGVIAVPIAGNPLRWRNLIGWHPDGATAAFSDQLVKLASTAYSDVIARSPRYSAFLQDNPGFGLERADHLPTS
ncbi:LysR family transcriptional regulator [Actinokineospora sp. NBRC 105648]|uniref:LysR substrate-binding domain-containing protein n=1 Tax=Actinokineospora sp. NBRC 105648 TaxID=3032206 RepID=UPI00249FEA91|nr:LysR family transcriptional regulator [Actinokineospora sp. NBRC 105648]GLZ41065.1 LysR family transcriptional regulator [Actinokineospora sp. NBRC 105648]